MYPIHLSWVGTGVADSAEIQKSCQSGPEIKKKKIEKLGKS